MTDLEHKLHSPLQYDDPAPAEALKAIALAIENLGNGNACTQMGAIEGHSVQVKQGLDSVADALREVAMAIRDNR